MSRPDWSINQVILVKTLNAVQWHASRVIRGKVMNATFSWIVHDRGGITRDQIRSQIAQDGRDGSFPE